MERIERRFQTMLTTFGAGKEANLFCFKLFSPKKVLSGLKSQYRQFLILTQISCLIPSCMYES